MAYTPDVLLTKTPFGNLPKSGQEASMTGVVASNIQTVDATGTPVTSPVSVASTSQTLTVPSKALLCDLSASAAFDVSDDSTHTAFFTVPANTVYTFHCWRMPKIYLHTGSTISISFGFKMLN